MVVDGMEEVKLRDEGGGERYEHWVLGRVVMGSLKKGGWMGPAEEGRIVSESGVAKGDSMEDTMLFKVVKLGIPKQHKAL
jgi:phosphoserine phosphatase